MMGGGLSKKQKQLYRMKKMLLKSRWLGSERVDRGWKWGGRRLTKSLGVAELQQRQMIT
jgi:hypothetical protein